MSSSTINSDTASDGATDPQKARPRRRRPARAAATTTTPVVEQATAPAPTVPETPTAEPIPLAGATDDAQRARAAGTANGRNRRGRGRGEGRKSAVQLIVPPTHNADGSVIVDENAEQTASAEPTAQEATAAQETTPITAQEARFIPVMTEATPAATAESAPVEPAPERSRYRFAPRTPVITAPPLVRPEKLSVGAAATSAPATEEPRVEAATTPAATTAQATTSTDDEAETDNWQATVAEVAPADVERSAAEAQSQAAAAASQAREDQAVTDLMSALGLHDRPAATQHIEPVTEAQADEAVEASTEGENGATDEAEGQNGTRRRRRRRRGSSHSSIADELDDDHTLADTLAASPALQDEEIEVERNSRNGYDSYTPYGSLDQPYSPYTRTPRERTPQQPSAWDVSASQQQQYGQSSAYSSSQSPYSSPEPNFARGFGPQPRGVAGPVREPLVRPARTERGTESQVSSSQLAQIVSNAISQQTDRLLTELRHQQPPSMMLQLPTMPSTERIGVFVDVANLFYSARSMRMSLDFGRMLDFLRSNRRLVRAHAYAPTNPDANADQSFLNAVKGMGYRITTKNYKTFSSGAKKADMDLDLCMDIVRIVDAGAVDTIVLVSGDSDFLPLLEYCSDHGVRVEVAAFDDAAAMILRQSCDLFINLSMVDEIRA